MSDPIDAFEHDHAHLGALVDALSELVGSARATAGAEVTFEQRVDLEETLGLLSEDLVSHFAREEEALFPAVVRYLPDLELRVRAVIDAHDRICGALHRLTRLCAPGAPGEIGGVGPLFERFEEAYQTHAREEVALLRTLDARLTDAPRAEVAAILRGL